MATRRTRKKADADLRGRILREATRLMAERGYGAVSLQEIADEAGATKQALLYHFSSREALRDAVMDALLEGANAGLVQLMTAATAGRGDRVDALVRGLEALVEAQPHAPALVLRMILDDDAQTHARIAEGTRSWLSFMVELIRQGQKDGTIRKELDPEAAVVQVGLLILSNFATLRLQGWTDASPAQWRKRRLAELARALRTLLFTPGAARPA